MIHFKKTFFLIATLFQTAVVFAVPQPIDILEMPSQNRKEIFQQLSHRLKWEDYQRIVNDESQTMKIRWRAMMALTRIDKTRAQKEIPKYAENKTWYLRNAAMIAMNELNHSQAAMIAEKLLRDPALVVRSAAIEILKNHLTRDRRDLLWDEFHQARNVHGKSNLWIREQILEVLAEKPLVHEKKLFEKLLKQNDTQIVKVAKSALERKFQ